MSATDRSEPVLARSRLEIGVDVPWVTSWSGETLLGAGPCATVGGAWAIGQVERPGFGRPNYSKNHVRRQRQCVRDMLCPMCGRPTRRGDRWTQTATRIAAGALRRRGLGDALPPSLRDEVVVFNAGSITPSHRACAERALEHCPHLKAYPDTTLLAFPDQWTTFPLLVAPPPGHLLARNAAVSQPAVLFLQLIGISTEVQKTWRRGRPA